MRRNCKILEQIAPGVVTLFTQNTNLKPITDKITRILIFTLRFMRITESMFLFWLICQRLTLILQMKMKCLISNHLILQFDEFNFQFMWYIPYHLYCVGMNEMHQMLNDKSTVWKIFAHTSQQVTIFFSLAYTFLPIKSRN